jgi:hypothetical protein
MRSKNRFLFAPRLFAAICLPHIGLFALARRMFKNQSVQKIHAPPAGLLFLRAALWIFVPVPAHGGRATEPFFCRTECEKRLNYLIIPGVLMV